MIFFGHTYVLTSFLTDLLTTYSPKREMETKKEKEKRGRMIRGKFKTKILSPSLTPLITYSPSTPVWKWVSSVHLTGDHETTLT